jgi:hypothetical protein
MKKKVVFELALHTKDIGNKDISKSSTKGIRVRITHPHNGGFTKEKATITTSKKVEKIIWQLEKHLLKDPNSKSKKIFLSGTVERKNDQYIFHADEVLLHKIVWDEVRLYFV